ARAWPDQRHGFATSGPQRRWQSWGVVRALPSACSVLRYARSDSPAGSDSRPIRRAHYIGRTADPHDCRERPQAAPDREHLMRVTIKSQTNSTHMRCEKARAYPYPGTSRLRGERETGIDFDGPLKSEHFNGGGSAISTQIGTRAGK